MASPHSRRPPRSSPTKHTKQCAQGAAGEFGVHLANASTPLAIEQDVHHYGVLPNGFLGQLLQIQPTQPSHARVSDQQSPKQPRGILHQLPILPGSWDKTRRRSSSIQLPFQPPKLLLTAKNDAKPRGIHTASSASSSCLQTWRSSSLENASTVPFHEYQHTGQSPCPPSTASSTSSDSGLCSAAEPGNAKLQTCQAANDVKERDEIVFWGGLPVRRAIQTASSSAPQSPIRHSHDQTRARRPDTAESYWSAYDLQAGALEQVVTNRPASKCKPTKARIPKAAKPPIANAWTTDNSKNKTAFPASLPLHPAVILDQKMLTPCQHPVDLVPTDDKGRSYPYVLPPCIPGTYPTIAFMGSAKAMQEAGLQPLLNLQMVVRYAGIANSPVKAAFKEAGWRALKNTPRWSVCWGRIFSAEELAGLHQFQRVNHFPGTWELGRKDYLYRNVSNLKRLKGSALDFIPAFFILPRDVEEFKMDTERSPGQMYIQKPVNSSRGRGVRMVVKPADLIANPGKDLLVQRYISNPYLVNGLKFDMRLYVMATCMDPLRLYVCEDGLARFATEPYSLSKSDLKKRCVHLTNYSVNKKSNKFISRDDNDDDNTASVNEQKDDQQAASKWSLQALRQHIERDRGPHVWAAVWRQVHDICAGAVLAAEPRISSEVRMKAPHRNICFEIWGFDVLLDDNMRCWLMEVNTCPSLAGDSALDRRIKKSMITDAMNLVGPVPYDHAIYEAHAAEQRQCRLTGLQSSKTPSQARTLQPSDVPSTPRASPTTHSTCSTPKHGSSRNTPREPAASLQAAVQMQMPRTVSDAEQVDFRGVAQHQLPEIVIEAEAELHRKRSWQRVFPCPEEPTRYLDLFETPRASSTLLCNYYIQKAGGMPLSVTNSSLGTTGCRPRSASGKPPKATAAWRPGGMA